MRKKYLKVVSLSLLLSTFAFTGCGNDIKITFNSDSGEIVRTIKKGETLTKDKIPQPPHVKGKYCLWDEIDYQSLTEDVEVNYACYDSVVSLEGNILNNIDVEVSSEEADIDNILKNVRLIATLEGNENNKRYLYNGDYIVNLNGYNKDVSGSYRIELVYNNKKLPININVKKISNYVSAYLGNSMGYLNEGLPAIYANTSVPGNIKFDDNQALSIGTLAYKWTFTPNDKNKYEVVHGKSEVKIIDASEIVTNKDDIVLNFDYHTSKSDIINAIKEELIVRGKFDDVYREISEQYYKIESDYKADRPGDGILFTISYGDRIEPAKIYVNVKKNSNYDFKVNDVENCVIDSETELEDLTQEIITSYVDTKETGTFSFVEGQVLKPGSYKYQYVFKPDNEYYATKTGEITINATRVVDIEVSDTYMPEYKYGEKTKEEIAQDIKEGFKGVFVYNDSTRIDVDNSLISVHIPSYDPHKPGEYTYFISYDNINVEYTFKLNKRVLKEGSNKDFVIILEGETGNNADPYIFPDFTLIDSNNSFDETKFTVVPDLSRDIEVTQLYCIYYIAIVPDDDLKDEYETVYTMYIFPRLLN